MDDFQYHMTEFKCLKAIFIFKFFKSYKWKHMLLTTYDVIIPKTMSPRKSEKDVVIKFCKS